LDDVKADNSARRDLKTMMMASLFLVTDPVPLLFAAAKFVDLVDENLKDPVRMTKSSRRDPHGQRQLTRVNSANVLDEGLRIRGRATTRDSGIEIGTRCTQVHVPVEARYTLLAI
jgi:hypothetical protein